MQFVPCLEALQKEEAGPSFLGMDQLTGCLVWAEEGGGAERKEEENQSRIK